MGSSPQPQERRNFKKDEQGRKDREGWHRALIDSQHREQQLEAQLEEDRRERWHLEAAITMQEAEGAERLAWLEQDCAVRIQEAEQRLVEEQRSRQAAEAEVKEFARNTTQLRARLGKERKSKHEQKQNVEVLEGLLRDLREQKLCPRCYTALGDWYSMSG